MTRAETDTMEETLIRRPDVTRLAERFFLISADNESRFPFCNVFLITGAQNVLIDCGIGRRKLAEIDQICPIDSVIITHPHPDHITGFEVVKDRHLMMPVQTGEEIRDLVGLGTRFTGTPELGVYWAEFASDLGIIPMKSPDSRFDDGDILDFGSVRLKCLHVPGHINDHYCFFELDSRILLTTDIDFSPFGPWYGNPESAISPFRDAIEKLMGLEYRLACSSHREPADGLAASLFKRFLGGFDRHRSLVMRELEEPKTLSEIVLKSPFYKNRLTDKTVQMIFEKNMILKNLEMLIAEEAVVYRDGRYHLAG